jgi:two-component sensor histidine kinase
MRLDFRSVILACNLLIFFVALLLWIYALTLKRRSPEILAWASAYGAIVVGTLLIILRNSIPVFFSIVLSNLAIVASMVAVRVGVLLFRGRRPRWRLVSIGLAVLFLWACYFTFAEPSLPARFYFYNSCIAGVALWNAITLARRPGPELAVVSRIAASMQALLGLASLSRIVLALAFGLPGDLMAASTWDSILQLLMGLAACILAFSLILMRAERLNAELARAVLDRELLVREMAHRTKNDLALVDSLISLEQGVIEAAGDPSSEKGIDRLDALRERIRCMGRAHERLSMSKELGTIRLDEYLDAVAEGLPSRLGVEVKRDFAAAEVPFSMAAPLGLVMNELAVNALKHAFPEGRRGKLGLELRIEAEAGEGRLRLEVSDDGVGAAWPPARPGLGSMIVESFAAQLGGRLDYSSEGGSRFVLSFAVPVAR